MSLQHTGRANLETSAGQLGLGLIHADQKDGTVERQKEHQASLCPATTG